MEIIIFLAILIGSILLPPIVETIFLRFKRTWTGPVAGSLSVFILWPLIYLLPLPDPLTDPIGESQAMGALVVFGFSLFFALTLLVCSLGLTAIVSLVLKRSHHRIPYRAYYWRPWGTLGLVFLFLVLVFVFGMIFDSPASLFLIIFGMASVATFHYFMLLGTGLFGLICFYAILAPFVKKRLPAARAQI